jgi:6-phosphogluconolactonase
MRLRLLFFYLFISVSASSQSFFMFIGTYTDHGSKGIYVYRFNASTGKLQWVSNTDSIVNPSYLAISPDKQHVYAVTETARNNSGSISAFSFNHSSGKLAFINKQTSGGDNPCYVSVYKSNKWVLVANYSGGSLSAFKTNKDGSLQPYNQLIQHEGKGINEQRQEKPHVHSVVFSPAQDYLFTPDLGLDKVFIYSFNPTLDQPLRPASPPYASSIAGSGPRHFTFHPNKKYAYLVEEMSGTVVAYKYNAGKLTLVQRIAAHPASYTGEIGSADIHISPDGKFLYASNRGNENTVTIFSIDKNTGRLNVKDFESTRGVKPRNFIIDPTGKYLIVANQDSNNIVVFKRNAQTGLLTATGDEIQIPNPVCLQMMKE